MEFKGRISKVMPARSGISQRTGLQWKALPFIFSYFEDDNARYEDRIMFETFDTTVMAKIAKYMVIGEDGKAVVENGQMKLRGIVPCTIGFDHRVREYDGRYYNDVHAYKIELEEAATIDSQPAAPAPAEPTQAPAAETAQTAHPTEIDWDAMGKKSETTSEAQTQENDELPF